MALHEMGGVFIDVGADERADIVWVEEPACLHLGKRLMGNMETEMMLLLCSS